MSDRHESNYRINVTITTQRTLNVWARDEGEARFVAERHIRDDYDSVERRLPGVEAWFSVEAKLSPLPKDGDA